MSLNYRDPTTGNLTRLDGVTMDSSPTSGSGNAVSSGGVYTALGNKAEDNGVVHITGNESIGGTKTFTSQIKLTDGTDEGLLMKVDNPTPDGKGGSIKFSALNNESLGTSATIYIDPVNGSLHSDSNFVIDSNNTLSGNIRPSSLTLPINPSTTPTTNGSIWITT